MYRTLIQQLALQIILKAIEQKTKVAITVKSQGTTYCSYQDRIGTYHVLELYMSNYADIDGKTGLRLISAEHVTQPGGNEEGSIFIDWNEIRNISVVQNYKRSLLKIGDMTFNFMDPIKDI